MRTKDLFAGCSVTIEPHEEVWLVSLHTDALRMITLRTYHELLDAIEAVHEKTLMLSDETEIVHDGFGVLTRIILSSGNSCCTYSGRMSCFPWVAITHRPPPSQRH
jgi:hypothetical protein